MAGMESNSGDTEKLALASSGGGRLISLASFLGALMAILHDTDFFYQEVYSIELLVENFGNNNFIWHVNFSGDVIIAGEYK